MKIYKIASQIILIALILILYTAITYNEKLSKIDKKKSEINIAEIKLEEELLKSNNYIEANQRYRASTLKSDITILKNQIGRQSQYIFPNPFFMVNQIKFIKESENFLDKLDDLNNKIITKQY